MAEAPKRPDPETDAGLANRQGRNGGEVIRTRDDVERASKKAGEEGAHPCHSTLKHLASSGEAARGGLCAIT